MSSATSTSTFAHSSLLPWILLAVQTSLWILKGITGYQIAPGERQTSQSRASARQFGIVHLFAATTAVAVTMFLVPLAVEGTFGRETGIEWLPMMVIFGIMATASAATSIPAVWIAFVPRLRIVGVLLMLVAVVGMTIVCAWFSRFGGRSWSEIWRQFPYALSFVATFHGSVLGVLLTARACGFAIQSGRKPSIKSEPSAAREITPDSPPESSGPSPASGA